MSIQTFDVVVVGAGIVGAAFALALRSGGLKVAVIEASPPSAPSDAWDSRIYAISPGSARWLTELGVWQTLDAARIAPVYKMQIHGDTAAQIEFDAYAAGLPQLAHIMESGRIQHGLWQALQTAPHISVLSGARCAAIDWHDAGAQLQLDDGRTLSTSLVVAADGAQSWVRSQAGITTQRSDYGQLGVVANFACERDHRNIARQWFRVDGVLAWLPLPGRRMSMVWSTPDAHAAELLALPAETLAARVAQAGNHELGALTLLTPAVGFPLVLSRVKPLVQPALALIGDAAHGVHPLAGQGVNLGLRDARELAQTLIQRGAAECGALPLLQRYARARSEDILTMQAVTDGLHTLFASPQPGLAQLRNRGLALTDTLTPVKNWLMQHALT
jgi:ubiquinone biosynthesis UbiH/UbiF/VisC/COQ6 family hydroxylase